jgi:predicted membrane protein
MNPTDRKLIAQDAPPDKTTPTPKATPTQKPSRWAYLLIILGVLSLLETFGLRNFVMPVIMVIIGVALVTRGYKWGGLLTFGLIVAGLLLIGGWLFTQPANQASTETIKYGITAARAEIELITSVGRLEINANNTGLLMDGSLEINSDERLEREDTIRSGEQFVRLEAVTTRANVLLPNFRGNINSGWKLGLSKNLPLGLQVKTGVGNAKLDLSELNVTDLTMNTGVGQASVTLPARGKVSARIEGGVGEIKIFLPRGMEARVRASSGIGAVRVLGNYQRNGDLYTSSHFETASNRVELEVQGGVGQISVETQP